MSKFFPQPELGGGGGSFTPGSRGASRAAHLGPRRVLGLGWPCSLGVWTAGWPVSPPVCGETRRSSPAVALPVRCSGSAQSKPKPGTRDAGVMVTPKRRRVSEQLRHAVAIHQREAGKTSTMVPTCHVYLNDIHSFLGQRKYLSTVVLLVIIISKKNKNHSCQECDRYVQGLELEGEVKCSLRDGTSVQSEGPARPLVGPTCCCTVPKLRRSTLECLEC